MVVHSEGEKKGKIPRKQSFNDKIKERKRPEGLITFIKKKNYINPVTFYMLQIKSSYFPREEDVLGIYFRVLL